MFQSSFELTGYITVPYRLLQQKILEVSKLFRAYGLYNILSRTVSEEQLIGVSKLFRAYGLYNKVLRYMDAIKDEFQSSFELTGYITALAINWETSILVFQSSFELTGYITSNFINSYFIQI